MSLCLGIPLDSQANCEKATASRYLTTELIAAGYTATSWTGASDAMPGYLGLPAVVSVSNSPNFMPSGTLLASANTSFLTGGARTAYKANQILFRCDLSDADSIYEMYATNGDDTWGGRYETDEIEGAYYTSVANVAIRLINNKTGEYFSRYWKSRKLTSDDWIQDSTKIYIPASGFSDVTTELFRIDSTSYYRNNSGRWLYSYAGPAGYIAFKGPGLNTANLTVGADSLSESSGFSANWPGGFSLYRDVTFVRGAMCLVKDYPSVVILPPITAADLRSGATSEQSFSISLQCQDSAISSVSTSSASSANVAMGFLVKEASSITAATNLGLTTGTGGLTHLLSTNYGSNGVASGVGIKIYNESGTALNLLPSKTTGTGNSGGWYAYKDLTSSQNDSTDGVSTYTGNFTASLEAISGQTVTGGSVNAQLQVVVSFQ